MTKTLALSVLLCVTVVPTAPGQTPPGASPGDGVSGYMDPAGGLTLERAIVLALEGEPALRAARTEVDVARGLHTQAGIRPNPMVSFSQQHEPGGMDRQTRVELEWPLDLFRRSGRVGVAEREIEAVQLDVADRERTLAADVRDAYGVVAAAIRELEVLDDLAAVIARQYDVVAARVDQGANPPLERDMLRVELRSLEADRLLRAAAVEQSMAGLKRLVGWPADTPLQLRDTLEQLVRQEREYEPGVYPDGIGTRADVRAAEARVRVTDASIERAQREGRFDMSLSAMYMRMNGGFPQLAVGAGGDLEPIRDVFHYLAVSATVMVPLSDRRQGEVAAARAARLGAIADLEAATLTARSEIAAARTRDALARRAADLFTADTLALARQNLEVVSRTHELGRGTVSDVLAEQRRYLDLQRAFTDTLREVYEARQALRRALGDMS